jgi:alcohol dehydrogenase class IV
VLTTVELVEHVRSVALEGQLAVVFGHTALDLENLGHQINHAVIEVKHDHHSVCTAMLLFKVIRLINFVEYRVVDATALY